MKNKIIKAWAVVANNKTIQTDAFYPSWQRFRSFYLLSRSKKEAQYWCWHFRGMVRKFQVVPCEIKLNQKLTK